MVEMEHSVTVSEASSTVSSTGNGSQVGAVMADEPSTSPPHAPPPTKRRRNQPGMPDPEAEVVALSPKTLMAKNRFVCEICGKGFQRDQNLQLHRRGHNLPWKLRQRTAGNEVKKRVYVCPEPGCVHHDPRRALGDLTGIKKHFYRKHGEKKWKCERCSKKYAVQSDWKAHMKTCGTKEYKCDCGTIFSRRDSFVTHRAFCDALTQESAKVDSLTILSPAAAAVTVAMQNDKASPPLSPPHVVVGAEAPAGSTSANFSPPLLSIHSPELQENQIGATHQTAGNGAGLIPASSPSNGNNSVFDTIFAPISGFSQPLSAPQQSSFFNLANSAIAPPPSPPPALSLSPFYQFPPNAAYASAPPHPAMSATALLQRAAEMGSSGPGSSLLCGFGLAVSPPPTAPPSSSSPRQHDKAAKTENGSPVADGLGLGLPSDETFGGSSPSMMDELFGSKPTTLDFLGLGVDTRNPYLESMSSPFGVAAAFGGTSSPVKGGAGWDDAAQRYTTGKE